MSNHTILIVDDHPTNHKLVVNILKRQGYGVMTATEAPETMVVLAKGLPSLILMDLQRPGLDGFELTRRIKADPRIQHIPVIAVTAFAMRGDEERARVAGADDCITKPIHIPRLVAAVAQGLQIKAAREGGCEARKRLPSS